MSPQRHQVELRPVDLDALLAPDHAARTVWAFVQTMDLAPLYARIKSVVCGMAKARAVLLWHALAHNLMRMPSLDIAFVG